MIFRLFGSRAARAKRTDPIRLASAGRPTAAAGVVPSDVGDDDGLAIVDTARTGTDPYNSTGRRMIEKIRRRS